MKFGRAICDGGASGPTPKLGVLRPMPHDTRLVSRLAWEYTLGGLTMAITCPNLANFRETRGSAGEQSSGLAPLGRRQEISDATQHVVPLLLCRCGFSPLWAQGVSDLQDLGLVHFGQFWYGTFGYNWHAGPTHNLNVPAAKVYFEICVALFSFSFTVPL